MISPVDGPGPLRREGAFKLGVVSHGTVRTLILTSSTGGGHNMRANSFVHWTREAYGRAAANEIQIHKCLENTHGLYRFGVGLYNRIQRYAPWAHHVYFNFLEVAAPCTTRATACWARQAFPGHPRPRPADA